MFEHATRLRNLSLSLSLSALTPKYTILSCSICPVSAHAAFDKAAQMLDIKMIHVPVDYKTRACNPRDVERAITRNTAFIVGSCPGFPHGYAHKTHPFIQSHSFTHSL